MKLDSLIQSPSGKPALLLRIGKHEAEILQALVRQAVIHTPRVAKTEKTGQRLKAMDKTLRSTGIQKMLSEFPDDED